MTTKAFDPYQPARFLAGSLGFTLYRQLGRCWLVDNFDFNRFMEVEEPTVWHPASYVIEQNAGKLPAPTTPTPHRT